LKTRFYILAHRFDRRYAFVVTKEFDSNERVDEAIRKDGEDVDHWFVERQFVLDTDIYERLPQYTKINAEEWR